jgi:hypothetical protein
MAEVEPIAETTMANGWTVVTAPCREAHGDYETYAYRSSGPRDALMGAWDEDEALSNHRRVADRLSDLGPVVAVAPDDVVLMIKFPEFFL